VATCDNLIEDHDGAGSDVLAIEGEAGDGHRRDPRLAQFASGLVGGGEADHRMPRPGGGDGGGVDHGGFAEPGRGDHATDDRPGGADGPGSVGLVGAQTWLFLGDGGFDQRGVDTPDAGGSQLVEKVKDLLLHGEVVDGGVLGRAPPGAVHQADRLTRLQELDRQVFDGARVKTAGAHGGDPLHHVRFAETGPVGAQPRLGVHQGVDDVIPTNRRPDERPVGDLGLQGMTGG
jgi:hypothetical protein